jgi:hypothetical protein
MIPGLVTPWYNVLNKLERLLWLLARASAHSIEARAKMPDFKQHLPTDCTCPPTKAEPTELTFYRLVQPNASPGECLLSWRELYPDRALPPEWEECTACGLSLYETVDGAMARRSALKKFRTHRVVKSELPKTWESFFRHHTNRETRTQPFGHTGTLTLLNLN